MKELNRVLNLKDFEFKESRVSYAMWLLRKHSVQQHKFLAGIILLNKSY